VIEWRESSPLLTNDGELFVSEGAGILKIKSILLSVMAIGLGIVTWGWGTTAQADLAGALNKSPQGVNLDSYFQTGTISPNSAKKVSTDFGESQAVQLTDNRSELGTIWTKDDAKMNLNSDETASMWMYFGDKNGSSGDGMAFVMQNDDHGMGASTKDASGNPVAGETLGVWGTDQDKNMSTAGEVAATGIQNSWALEFDTYHNDSTGEGALGRGSSFDIDDSLAFTHAHIASGFPGKAETYSMHQVPVTTTTKVQTGTGFLGLPIYSSVSTTKDYYYASMNHTKPIEGRTAGWLVDGSWYHVTLKWNATDQTMTYIFDDKDPKTGQPKANPTSKTVSVPKSAIDPDSTGQVRWGFTGSTGSNWEPNAVVFEQVPGIVNSNATAILKDETTQRTVASGDSVGGGHHMRLTYNLAYTGGSQNWKDIQAKLNLPSNMTFSGGTVTYGDSSLAKTSISAADLNTKSLTVPISEMSKTNPTATITLDGVAAPGDSALTMSKFIGSNALADATVPAFTVTAPTKTSALNMVLTGDSASGETNTMPDKDVPVTGQLKYDDNSAIDNGSMTLHPVLNGESLPTELLRSSDTAGAFTYNVPQAKLLSGQANDLKLYAEDTDGRISNEVTDTITVKTGSLDLSVPTAASFEPTTLNGKEQLIRPSSDLKVAVSDTRGKGNDWTLYAKSTSFMSKLRGTLPASLVYKSGATKDDLSAGYVKLQSATSTSDNDVTDVSGDWTADSGLLLDVQGDAVGGINNAPTAYTGVITWSFTNAPT